VRHPFLLVVALSIACTVLFTAGASGAGPGGWSHVGNSALNGAVYALNADDPGVLFVGGAFTSAGGNPGAQHIARWNGATWSPVGSPALNGAVDAIAYRAGKVYVGGQFTNAGGNQNADFLAVWDGVSWKPFCSSANGGPAFGGSVLALQIIGSTLYVGGAFQNGGAINAADYLLACDLNTGASSSTVPKDGDISGGVYALTADSNGTLYAAGQFINMERIAAADHVAAYNGTWHAMGSGPSQGGGALDDYARSITAHGTDVYVGTDSLNIGGIAQADHVARWNGSAWSAMGSATGGANGWFPASSFLYAMTTSGSRVFAAGSFQNANGDPRADFIASFDGSAWHNVGSNGAGNGPWLGNGLALAPFGALLYAGGNFTSAGGDNQAGSIASYPLVATPPKITNYTLSPNAFDPPKTTTVKYRLSKAARVTFTVQRAGRKMGAFTRAGRIGANQFRFNGKVGGKTLTVGRYSLVAGAVDSAGLRSARLGRAFKITG
jgi:trimeric autotransporter adhesin